ncbi:tRNA(His) guanylyltransferase 1 [Vitis vinifera]|uniref:tRNA(His) guanylyltransferase n=1 Tax=Vitis vinifera TaxID=29760 RepID=A0A438F5D4_VITVI|nr:tRNA(His) guanylyltransferase 1 [Vitis vinifera]
MPPNLIVVRIDGRGFRRFSEVHEFEKPNDERALNLMNSCAAAMLEEYPDIVFSYGFSDEYSFVFKKTTKFYQRRASKIVSLVVSFFTSIYTTKWKEFFPHKELRYPPSFRAWVICCASMEVLQTYLAWRQNDCHINNQYNTCFWMLVKCGKTEEEAQEVLKVEAIVKYSENGTPVKRLRRKPIIVHSDNIAARSFWNEHPFLLKELGDFREDINNIKPEYVKSFQFENKLMPLTWIVVRIDGCHFHRFSEVHEFEKPNDEQALNLMNSCAVAVLEQFKDVIFSYGVSDEYSFVLKKDSQFYQRRGSEIVTALVSYFTSIYVMKWKEFFPQKELKYPPCFDGRAVLYPTSEILRDYLTWRQATLTINIIPVSGCLLSLERAKSEAQAYLKGTQAREKNEVLLQQFGIDYNTLPLMFRQGSSAFWNEEEKTGMYENGASAEKSGKKVVVEQCNIIEQSFWEAHPSILNEKPHMV